jgi:hypothetical protein
VEGFLLAENLLEVELCGLEFTDLGRNRDLRAGLGVVVVVVVTSDKVCRDLTGCLTAPLNLDLDLCAAIESSVFCLTCLLPPPDASLLLLLFLLAVVAAVAELVLPLVLELE